MYIEFNNISEARIFSRQFYKLFVHKEESTIFLYDVFKCELNKGWVEIPNDTLFMRHKRRSNFSDIFSRIKPILTPIFTTPIREVRSQMTDSRRLDVNKLMRDNCILRDRAYMYANGHLIQQDESDI